MSQTLSNSQHEDAINASRRERYWRRVSEGLCPICGKQKVDSSIITCVSCLQKQAHRRSQPHRKAKTREYSRKTWRAQRDAIFADPAKLEASRAYSRKRKKIQNKRLRLEALRIIGGERGIKCVNCGCDEISILEINHKNGDASKVGRKGENCGGRLVELIVRGRRRTDDLEITCRLCNQLHYVLMIHPELMGRFRVVWSDNR